MILKKPMSAKQKEQIQEGIFKIILDNCWTSESEEACILGASLRIMEYLHDNDVAIKVDRELPESPSTDYLISQYKGEEATPEDVALMNLNGIEKGKRLMLKAGYVAVESLI